MFKHIQKQHALKHFKDLCSIRRHETSALRRIHRANVHSIHDPSLVIHSNQSHSIPPSSSTTLSQSSTLCISTKVAAATPHTSKNNVEIVKDSANSSDPFKIHASGAVDADACITCDHSFKNSSHSSCNSKAVHKSNVGQETTSDFTRFSHFYETKADEEKDCVNVLYKKVFTPIEREVTIDVCLGLLKWISNDSYPCDVDSFLLSCKVSSCFIICFDVYQGVHL